MGEGDQKVKRRKLKGVRGRYTVLKKKITDCFIGIKSHKQRSS